MATATANIIEIGPQPGKQNEFLGITTDIGIYGGHAGSGKTFGVLLQPLLHMENPGFTCVIFRRTYPEITNAGGLWDESFNIYPQLGASPRHGDLSWTFPSGARVMFRQLQHEHDVRKYQGSQIPLIIFDQIEHFTERQVVYMLSRNRSACGVHPYVRATCNPMPNWLSDFLSYWIDDSSGYAIEERAGHIRWMVRIADNVVWADTREELCERYPELQPKSVTFLPATLEDNPALTNADPGYLANLQALGHVDRERLLKGNWLIRDTDGAEWPADYWMNIWAEEWPESWELSAIAVDPSKGVERGDPSAIVFVGLSAGKLWIDADIEVRPSEKIILDGVAMARESWPDAFGVEANGFQELLGAQYDRMCEANKIPPLPINLITNTTKKLTRIRRLGPYFKNGKVRVRRNSGGRVLLDQLSGFPLPDVHDDGPDAMEMAIRLLNSLAQGMAPRESGMVTA